MAVRTLLLLLNMDSFIEYLKADNYSQIIKVLCKKRAKCANKRHDEILVHSMSPEYSLSTKKMNNEEYDVLTSMMPSRRKWFHLYPNERIKNNNLINTFDYNNLAILKRIRHDINKGSNAQYLNNLLDFCKKVVSIVESPSFTFAQPITIPKIKKTKKDEVECRPITIFSKLEEYVILTLANKFLTRLLDADFYEESLAFRAPRFYHGKNVITTHHDAIKTILKFRDSFEKRNIYVAECDMQKFYDTVGHNVVRKSFYELIRKHEKCKDKDAYKSIKRIVEAYLKCYSFPQNVLSHNSNLNYWESHNIVNGKFNWIEEQDYPQSYSSYATFGKAKVGIPQGGALSGLFANIVLNQVDLAVSSHLTNHDMYIRYCDDMILLSTNKTRCEKLFNIYSSALEKVNLIPHKPEANCSYNRKSFWKCKTKKVYKWDIGKETCQEWIGFVGYEVKRNGDVRIRKSSLSKEIKKQKDYVNKILKKIDKKDCVSVGSLRKSCIRHLISMSVGRVELWNAERILNEMCWINGFRELRFGNRIKSQIRELDYYRNRTISIAVKKFKGLTGVGKATSNKENDRESDSIVRYGKPFSYYYHFYRIAEKNKK